MSRIETNTSPITPGAGRKYSYNYSSIGRTTNLNDPNGDVALQRGYMSPSQSFYSQSVTGAPPTPRGMIQYNGRCALQMTSSTGTGYTIIPNFGGVNRPLTMPFQTVKGPGNFSQIDDLWCWSVSAILAFDAIPGAVTGDIGVTVGPGTATTIKVDSFPGVELGPINTGQLGVTIRQVNAGAITFAQATPTQPDLTQFNRYEIRLVGPTASQEAQIKFFVNNVLQFALPYGAGTVLPDQIFAAGNNMGMTPGLVNRAAVPGSTTRMYLAAFGLTVAGAPNEDMLSAATI